MAQFEKYHPILTAHFQLDWLTRFRVNAINELRIKNGHHEGIVETADFVNRQMSQIMKANALVWGIGDRESDNFLGLFGFHPIDLTNQTGEIVLELSDKSQSAGNFIFTELLPHMMAFANEELHLKTLTVAASSHLDDWAAMGFATTPEAGVLACRLA